MEPASATIAVARDHPHSVIADVRNIIHQLDGLLLLAEGVPGFPRVGNGIG